MKKAHPLTKQRDADLRNLYTQVIKKSGVNPMYLPRETILDALSEHTAPRFYIEPFQARHYVTLYYSKRTIHKSPIKQAMIRNLVEVFETIRPQHMNLPMAEIWQMVVEHPAKSFYLSRQRIKEIILNYRTK